MSNILSIVEEATSGKCYKSFRYCTDEVLKVHSLSYEEPLYFTILKDKYGETVFYSPFLRPQNIKM
jgi:hypothetical protein